MSFNPKTLKTEVLAEGLMFANGVSVSYDKTSILVAETGKARILR
jgi:sugar lactone lactonase YvrE